MRDLCEENQERGNVKIRFPHLSRNREHENALRASIRNSKLTSRKLHVCDMVVTKQCLRKRERGSVCHVFKLDRYPSQVLIYSIHLARGNKRERRARPENDNTNEKERYNLQTRCLDGLSTLSQITEFKLIILIQNN